jgi:DNA adenine methylase
LSDKRLPNKVFDAENPTSAPLMKWAGGKRAVLKHILPLVSNYSHYYEPFVGGGALFFALHPLRATVADKNLELVHAYVQVRDRCEDVISALQALGNSEGDYYQVRRSNPKTHVGRAARLLYLTRLSFNGIYRVNLKGQFNVPYGYKSYLPNCDPEHLRLCSRMLAGIEILHSDFAKAVAHAKKGDLVYLDPPYTVAHENNGFVKYNAKIFSWEDQIRLADVAQELAKKKCKVIVSNAYHKSILRLYPRFSFAVIERQSVMAASSRFRRQIQECIFFN